MMDRKKEIEGQPWRYIISGHGKGDAENQFNLYEFVEELAKQDKKYEGLRVNLIFTVPSGQFAFDSEDERSRIIGFMTGTQMSIQKWI